MSESKEIVEFLLKKFEKLSKLAIASTLFGIFVIIFSSTRWFLIHPDPSQLYMGNGIGFAFIVFVYLYNKLKGLEIRVEKSDARMDAIVNYWMREANL